MFNHALTQAQIKSIFYGYDHSPVQPIDMPTPEIFNVPDYAINPTTGCNEIVFFKKFKN